MKLTIKNYEYEYSVESEKEDLTPQEVFEDLFIPLLRSLGYGEKAIKELIK